jgi:hypothetical protein
LIEQSTAPLKQYPPTLYSGVNASSFSKPQAKRVSGAMPPTPSRYSNTTPMMISSRRSPQQYRAIPHSESHSPSPIHMAKKVQTKPFDCSKYEDLEMIDCASDRLEKGITVRLGEVNGQYFLKILHILRELGTENVFLRGRKFIKNENLSIVEDGYENEVTMIVSAVSSEEESFPAYQVPIEEATGVVRLCFISRNTDPTTLGIDEGTLLCRFLFVTVYNNEKRKKQSQSYSGVIRALRLNDGEAYYDLVEENIIPPRAPNQSFSGTYEFTDIYAGFGGASSGAELAGLKPKAFVEKCPVKASVYGLNFPNADAYVQDVKDAPQFFCDHTTDVCSCSAPCPFWSKAHNQPGKNDNENRDLLFEIPKIIDLIKPRQVCVEQVDGIIERRKHRPYFDTLIRGIHSLGYSVAWGVFNLVDYGLPAQRRRLIIFASA